MMKFNEGLQVLICMVISVLLIFVTLGISSIITINSATSSIFFYSFISFILLMICNFCCAVMILPRLFSIWKGLDDEEYVNRNDEDKAVKKYMKTLRSNLNKLYTRKVNTQTSMVSLHTNEVNASTLDLTSTQTNTENEDIDQSQQENMLKPIN
eukprot:UN07350